MSGAIADSVAETVERRQRNQQDVGNEFGGIGRRLENAEPAAPQSVAGSPAAKFQRLIARHDRRQRQPHARRGELSQQGSWVDLAADRRVPGDDRAGHDFNRQSACSDGLCRRAAVLVAQRITRCEGGGAEGCFLVFRRGRRTRHSPPSCPALCRASTSSYVRMLKTWMAGTSPAMTTAVVFKKETAVVFKKEKVRSHDGR